MVLGVEVHDPRLRQVYYIPLIIIIDGVQHHSFPPSNTRVVGSDPVEAHTSFTFHPSSAMANTTLWEADVRELLRKPRFKKKDLDERRSSVWKPFPKSVC